MTNPVRRIVVAQDKNDNSYFVKDEPAKDIDHFITGIDEAVSINLWSTNANPSVMNIKDPTEGTGLPFLPPEKGTIFRICDIPPNSTFINRLNEILLNNEKITDEQKALKHPLMHKIDAICYGIVLQGNVTLILDNDETLLKEGDVVIDCGSHHAWSNHTTKICRMAFVLIDAERK